MIIDVADTAENRAEQILSLRTGYSDRTRDVTEQDIIRVFNLRDFSIEDSVTAVEKQAYLNILYDSLSDLATALDIPKRMIGLENTIAIRQTSVFNKSLGYPYKTMNAAFRNTDGKKVIFIRLLSDDNNRIGAVGHEWGHALDCFLKDKNDKYNDADSFYRAFEEITKRCLSEKISLKYVVSLDNWQDITPYFKGDTVYKKAAKINDKGRLNPYNVKPAEMFARAFDIYLASVLAEKGIENHYLCTDITEKNLTRFPDAHTFKIFRRAMDNTARQLSQYCKDENIYDLSNPLRCSNDINHLRERISNARKVRVTVPSHVNNNHIAL